MEASSSACSVSEEQRQAQLELTRAVGYLAARVGHGFQRALLDELRAAGYALTVEEWRLLRTLWTEGESEAGVLQSTLVSVVLKDKAQVSRMLSRLEEQGWITRAPDKQSRRTVRVRLTGAGRALEARLLPLGAKVRTLALAGLDEASLRATLAGLQTMLGNLQERT